MDGWINPSPKHTNKTYISIGGPDWWVGGQIGGWGARWADGGCVLLLDLPEGGHIHTSLHPTVSVAVDGAGDAAHLLHLLLRVVDGGPPQAGWQHRALLRAHGG